MRILCILAPPIAVLIAGKPWQALLNLAMVCTVIGVIGAWIHAWVVVSNYYADKRTDRIVDAMRSSRQ